MFGLQAHSPVRSGLPVHSSWKTVIGAGTLAASLVLASSAFGFQNEGTVRIGFIETQTGNVAVYGLPGLNGSKIAIDEINAAGGVKVDGKMVKLEITPSPNGYDPGIDGPTMIGLIKKLMFDDKVLLVKGPTWSAGGETAFNYANELDKAGTPIVVHSSSVSAPGLGKISRWGFRNFFDEMDVIPRFTGELKEKLGLARAGVFIQKDNAYAPALFEQSVKPGLEKNGITIAAVTDGLTSDRDFVGQVDTLKKANVDVVYVIANGIAALSFMKEATRRELKPKIFVGGQSQLVPEFLKAPGMEHMVIGAPFDPTSAGIVTFTKKYRERFNQDLPFLAVTGYDAMYLLKAAIETSGIKNTPESLEQDRKAIRDALEKAEAPSITGATLRFKSPTVHDTSSAGFLLTVRDAKFVPWDGKAAR